MDQDLIDRLNAVHNFPEDYEFKVIGPNDVAFVARVTQTVVNVMGKDTDISLRTRESSSKNHLSVTVECKIEKAEQVIEIYSVLKQLEGVKFML